MLGGSAGKKGTAGSLRSIMLLTREEGRLVRTWLMKRFRKRVDLF